MGHMTVSQGPHVHSSLPFRSFVRAPLCSGQPTIGKAFIGSSGSVRRCCGRRSTVAPSPITNETPPCIGAEHPFALAGPEGVVRLVPGDRVVQPCGPGQPEMGGFAVQSPRDDLGAVLRSSIRRVALHRLRTVRWTTYLRAYIGA
jgi:hypothetical protein